MPTEPNSTAAVQVTSEEAAFELLKRAIEAGSEPSLPDIDFSNWPVLRLRATGDKFQSSLTPASMSGIVDFHRGLQKSVAFALYGVPDARKLSPEERESLEFKLEVGPGSSLVNVDLSPVFDALLKHPAVQRMEPGHIVIIVLGLALIWAGSTAFKAYMAQRSTTRQAELNVESERVRLDAFARLSSEETQRMRLLSSAMSRHTQLSAANSLAFDARTKILRGLSGADTLEINDIGDFMGEDIEQLVRNARAKLNEINLDGAYKVVSAVRRADESLIKAKIRAVDSPVEFEADISSDMVLADEHGVLIDAFKSNVEVYLRVRAKNKENVIKSAKIFAASLQPFEAVDPS